MKKYLPTVYEKITDPYYRDYNYYMDPNNLNKRYITLQQAIEKQTPTVADIRDPNSGAFFNISPTMGKTGDGNATLTLAGEVVDPKRTWVEVDENNRVINIAGHNIITGGEDLIPAYENGYVWHPRIGWYKLEESRDLLYDDADVTYAKTALNALNSSFWSNPGTLAQALYLNPYIDKDAIHLALTTTATNTAAGLSMGFAAPSMVYHGVTPVATSILGGYVGNAAGEWITELFTDNPYYQGLGGYAGMLLGGGLGYKAGTKYAPMTFELKIAQDFQRATGVNYWNPTPKLVGRYINGQIGEVPLIFNTLNYGVPTERATLIKRPLPSQSSKQPRYIDVMSQQYPNQKMNLGYFGPKHSVSEVVNPDGSVNWDNFIKIADEVAESYSGEPGVYKLSERLENPEWHKTDPNTLAHTKEVVLRALEMPVLEGYTKLDQVFAALGHDFGKMFAGEGHAEAGALILKLIFPDMTDAQYRAIALHMISEDVAQMNFGDLPLLLAIMEADRGEPLFILTDNSPKLSNSLNLNNGNVTTTTPELTSLSTVQRFIDEDIIPRMRLQGHDIESYTPTFRIMSPETDLIDEIHEKNGAGAWFTLAANDITLRGPLEEQDFGLLIHESGSHGLRYNAQPDYNPPGRQALNEFVRLGQRVDPDSELGKLLLNSKIGDEVFNSFEINNLQESYPYVQRYYDKLGKSNSKNVLHELAAINTQFRAKISLRNGHVVLKDLDKAIDETSDGVILKMLDDLPYTSIGFGEHLSEITGKDSNELVFLSEEEFNTLAKQYPELHNIATRIKNCMKTVPAVIFGYGLDQNIQLNKRGNKLIRRNKKISRKFQIGGQPLRRRMPNITFELDRANAGIPQNTVPIDMRTMLHSQKNTKTNTSYDFTNQQVRINYVMGRLIREAGFNVDQAAALVGVYLDENGLEPTTVMAKEKAGKGAKSTRGNNEYGAGPWSWTGQLKKALLRNMGLPEDTLFEKLPFNRQVDGLIASTKSGPLVPYFTTLRKYNGRNASLLAIIMSGGVGYLKNWKNPTSQELERAAQVVLNAYIKTNGNNSYHRGLIDRRYLNAVRLRSKKY